MHLFGLDVGGSGIKGSIVDATTGVLQAPRFRLPTPDPATPEAQWPALAMRLADVIHRALHVRLDVTAVKPGGLPRYDLKTKRIIDQRPKEFRRALDR